MSRNPLSYQQKHQLPKGNKHVRENAIHRPGEVSLPIAGPRAAVTVYCDSPLFTIACRAVRAES